jgi:polyhydroxybutyrate depolymerase
VTADDSTNQLYGYTSKFADVDNNTYYAHAIAWAANVGIVTGTSETTFEPERNVTREEFVTMLQRYANLCENGKAVAKSTSTELTKYTDGTTVCDWAKDAVAWASEKEIMTGYAGTTVLDPEGAVTRAQVAKMAVAYQKSPLNGSILGSTNTDKNNQVNVTVGSNN